MDKELPIKGDMIEVMHRPGRGRIWQPAKVVFVAGGQAVVDLVDGSARLAITPSGRPYWRHLKEISHGQS